MNLFSRFQSEECDHDWEEVDAIQQGVEIDGDEDELRLMQTVFYWCAECHERKMEKFERATKTYRLTEVDE